MREGVVVFCKGAAMGAADVVPGVSGATIALIVGVYDRLIRAITAIDPRVLVRGGGLTSSAGRRELRRELIEMDVPFLLVLGAGVLTAIVALANVMAYATTAYPVPTYAFFTGLIAASAVVLYADMGRLTPNRVIVGLIGIVLAVAVTGVTGTDASHALPMVFLAGAVAICAMVLPGVSGAFLLLVLGQYEYMTGVLSDFTTGMAALASGESISSLAEPASVIAVFGSGAIIGLFSMAHAVQRALERYRAATMTFLVSLMVGALRLPIEAVWIDLGTDGANAPATALMAGVVGAGIVLFADRYVVDRRSVPTPSNS